MYYASTRLSLSEISTNPASFYALNYEKPYLPDLPHDLLGSGNIERAVPAKTNHLKSQSLQIIRAYLSENDKFDQELFFTKFLVWPHFYKMYSLKKYLK